MLNVMLALMVKYSQLTAEEAEKISDEVARSIKPARYHDAEKMIERILTDISK